MQLKPGTRIKSAVCATEMMVIQAPAGDADVRCGGAPMLGIADAKPERAIDPDLKAGTQIGKRYVDEADTIQVLCTKAGTGTLAVDGKPLQIQAAKPLPASD